MRGLELELTDARAREIGKAHPSDKVEREAAEVAARWKNALPVLALYGAGAAELEWYENLRKEHAKARATRPEVVAAKGSAVTAREEAVTAGWRWCDQVTSIIKRAARKDKDTGVRLFQAAPADDANLRSGIAALAELLSSIKGAVPADCQADARIAEAPSLIARLDESTEQVSTSKTSALKDTAAIDILDGKLYVAMRDLNDAGRKAIRAGLLDEPLSHYRLHHLNRTSRPGAVEEPPPGK